MKKIVLVLVISLLFILTLSSCSQDAKILEDSLMYSAIINSPNLQIFFPRHLVGNFRVRFF